MTNVLAIPKPKGSQMTKSKKNIGTISWFQQSIHRSQHEVFSTIVIVSPELAEVILTQNADNRNLRESKIAQFASDMLEGRWTLNGEAIVIAKSGDLNDGQHRLMAIKRSGVSQKMLFIFGVERDSRLTLDQGVNRTVSDYLQMEGKTYTNTIASVSKLLLNYEKNKGKMIGNKRGATPAQVLARANSDETILTSAKYANRHMRKTKTFAPMSVLGFCHNVLMHIDVNDGLAFMEMLTLGENISRTDVVFKARDRLVNLQRRGAAAQIEIIFRAWNAYREKRDMRTIPILGNLPELV